VSMGVRFGTYATFWAKAAIRHALHEQTRVVRLPARVHHTFGKIKRATDSLAAQSADRDQVTDAQVRLLWRVAPQGERRAWNETRPPRCCGDVRSGWDVLRCPTRVRKRPPPRVSCSRCLRGVVVGRSRQSLRQAA
jgi:hypothetical protein